MYVSGRVDVFDMVDINLFTVVALNMMVLKLGLYALACEEDVRCMATLVRSFKLIEVYIEHSVDALDSYLRAPRFRATLEEINDELAGSIAVNRTEKMLLLTWHECSETPKEHVCDSVTSSSLPQADCILTPPTDESVITYTQLSGVQGVDTQSHVIDDVMRQLSFDETELDGEAGFADVAGSGVDSSGLIHDESFIVDDFDLNLNEEPDVNLNVFQVETQFELPVSEEPDVEVSTQEPIVAEVSTEVPIVKDVGTQDFCVEDVVLEDYVSYGEDVAQYNGEFNESARSDGQFFFDDEGIDTEYDVQSSEDAGTDDDDDVDEDFLVDEENEIVEPDVDVHLFGEDVDVINLDGFDSDHGNDEETNCRKIRLAELRTEMKVHVFTMSCGDGPIGPNRGMEPGPSRSSGSTTRSKKGKNTGINADSQASSFGLDAHDKGDLCPWVLEIKHCTYKFLSEKIFEQVRVNPDIPVKAVQDQLQRELEVQISMSKAFRAKAKAEREIRGDHVLQYSMLRDYVVELQSTNPNTTVKIAVERNTDPSLPTRVFQRIYVCLGALKLGFRACRRDLLGLDGAFMKGPFPGQVLVAVGLDSNNGIYPLAYALVEAESKSSWCWFLQCLGDDIDLHPNSNFTFISDRQKVSIMVD
ncbi:heat stress transcription factor B-4-like protein [Tanacetum coccineum]